NKDKGQRASAWHGAWPPQHGTWPPRYGAWPPRWTPCHIEVICRYAQIPVSLHDGSVARSLSSVMASMPH
ncbi:hypothetical protein HAX54_041812, partial [Datura stramonium]|nr:hypothetical protein [Datura stramonium]